LHPIVTLLLPGLAVDASWLAFLTALALGALHALEPSHGKAVIGAYLVGQRKRLRDALLLSVIVAFTHTFSVIALALIARWGSVAAHLSQQRLGIAAGLLVCGVGLFGIVRFFWAPVHTHQHRHEAGHPHLHPLEDQPFVIHPEDEPAESDHGHRHGGYGELVALGVAGGLVPCFEGVALLSLAVSMGRSELGLALVSAFSAGLGIVVLLLSLVFIQTRDLIEKRFIWRLSGKMKYAPLLSALIIALFGGAMVTLALLGKIGE
jgi:ABC-type nickel/cobalt efflux system permease component RcnA